MGLLYFEAFFAFLVQAAAIFILSFKRLLIKWSVLEHKNECIGGSAYKGLYSSSIFLK